MIIKNGNLNQHVYAGTSDIGDGPGSNMVIVKICFFTIKQEKAGLLSTDSLAHLFFSCSNAFEFVRVVCYYDGLFVEDTLCKLLINLINLGINGQWEVTLKHNKS
jgi:hypothetical protein